MLSADNSLECRYLGLGDLNQFRQMPLAENEALIYTIFTRDVPVLMSGFLDCIRSEELREKLAEQFSENDLASIIVAMVRNLPDMRCGYLMSCFTVQSFLQIPQLLLLSLVGNWNSIFNVTNMS